MKTNINLILANLLLFITLSVQETTAQNIAVNTDGASPNSSAMFDIQSTNRGLLIPRVSISSTTDASTISSPATSLLVYNTNASISGSTADGIGYYYNAGTSGSPSWKKLATADATTFWKSTGNANTDSATNFIGTTDSKSLQLRTNGIKRINISSSGQTSIGDGTNQLIIDSTGHIRMQGAATVFTDLVVPPFSTYVGGSNPPLFVAMKNNGSSSVGVQTFTFQDQNSASNEQQVFFSIQMPHNWKEGSTVYPHIHWSPQTSGTGNVVWGFEYSWVNYDPTTPIVFPNTSTLTATTDAITSSSVDKHLITGFSSITPNANQGKISSILMCRLYRNSSNAADTYTGNAALLSFDLHYEIDALGSATLYEK